MDITRSVQRICVFFRKFLKYGEQNFSSIYICDALLMEQHRDEFAFDIPSLTYLVTDFSSRNSERISLTCISILHQAFSYRKVKRSHSIVDDIIRDAKLCTSSSIMYREYMQIKQCRCKLSDANST